MHYFFLAHYLFLLFLPILRFRITPRVPILIFEWKSFNLVILNKKSLLLYGFIVLILLNDRNKK